MINNGGAWKDLTPLFHPRSIALVGCSPVASGKLGSWALRNLLIHRSPVEIYPVNPRYDEMEGFRCYPDLGALPAPPDLVLLLLPAAPALDALDLARSVGARAAIMFAGGFGETRTGGDLQARLLETIAASDMPVCGPNTNGFVNVIDRIPCGWPPFAARTDVRGGEVAVVSQSGALLSSLVARMVRYDVGLTYACSVGNAADLTVSDFVHFVAHDERTETILVYLEGLTDRLRFLEAAGEARAAGKPVVVLKAGRSPEGREAAQSHTGSLVGSYDSFIAMCEAHGIVVADTIEELVALPTLTRAVGAMARPGGRRLGIVSGSGAVCGLLADKAVEHGFTVPPLGAEAQERLDAMFTFTSPQNPVDLTGEVVTKPELHAQVLDELVSDPDIDLVVSGLLYAPPAIAERMQQEVAGAAAKRGAVAVYTADGALRGDDGVLTAAGVGAIPSADLLFSCLAKLIASGRVPAPHALPSPDAERGASTRRDLAERALGGWDLLRLYGVPLEEEHVVASPAQARATAARLGWPLVAKLVGPELLHKSDVGAVRLGLLDDDALDRAFCELDQLRHDLDRPVSIVLQRQVDGGVELIVGARSDPESGPTVVVGLGGIYTELLGDVVVAPAPVDPDQALALLDRLRGAPLLRGARGRAPLAVRAAAEVVVAVSNLAADLDGLLAAFEVNPLVVTSERATAVDVLSIATGPAGPVVDDEVERGPLMQFTEEQEQFRQSVRRFVEKEMPPGFARMWDERGEPPLETYRRFAEAGFMGTGIPEAYGGAGGGIIELAIMLEELAKGMLSFATIVYRSAIHAAQGFLTYGSEEQRRTYLPQIASGEKLFCFSLSEPQAGSDAASIVLRADRDGDEYVLTGEKMWSSGAGYADFVFLATRTCSEGQKHAGITMFLVDLSSPGITITRVPTLGDRASGTNLVHYDGVRVPVTNMLGGLGQGWANLTANLEKERMCSAPMLTGAMDALLRDAVEYANTRVQFDHPIGTYQAVQHRLADVAVDIHIGKLLMWDTADRIARGVPCRKEASITKLFISEAYNRAAYSGMQVMGGFGYSMESDMQLHFRNARLSTIGAGSSEVMRNMIARMIGLPKA